MTWGHGQHLQIPCAALVHLDVGSISWCGSMKSSTRACLIEQMGTGCQSSVQALFFFFTYPSAFGWGNPSSWRPSMCITGLPGTERSPVCAGALPCAPARSLQQDPGLLLVFQPCEQWAAPARVPNNWVMGALCRRESEVCSEQLGWCSATQPGPLA